MTSSSSFIRAGIVAATVVAAAPWGACARAQDDGARQQAEHGGLRLSAAPRTPDQIAAFYGARGFPREAVAALSGACLITFGIRNDRDGVTWLEPGRWRFRAADGTAVRRITRQEWNARWDALDVPAASRATFGWTQLPEQRDLRPGEPVGGNLAIAPVAGPISLEARFHTGEDRGGPDLVLRLEGLRCPRGPQGAP
jgi:hypothetical protein